MQLTAAEDDDDPLKKFTVSGYIEAFYQWNFNREAAIKETHT